MIEYQEIHEAYQKIEDYLLRMETEDREHREEWTKVRRLNDHAYFLMLFAQLEQFINREARKLVKGKLAEKRHDRAWDIIKTKNLEDKHVFSDRVALLMDKGSHISKEINDYYRVRCDIAHGILAGIPVAISGSNGFAMRIQELAGAIETKGGMK